MQVQFDDLARVRRLLGERETHYKELASRVARGEATMAELADAQEHLRELQVLAAAIETQGRATNPDPDR